MPVYDIDAFSGALTDQTNVSSGTFETYQPHRAMSVVEG